MTAVRTISPAPRNAWLPDGGRGEVMKPCCARCRRGIKGSGSCHAVTRTDARMRNVGTRRMKGRGSDDG